MYMWGAVDPEAVSRKDVTVTVSDNSGEMTYIDAKTGKAIDLDDIPESVLSDLLPKGSLDLSGSFRKRFI